MNMGMIIKRITFEVKFYVETLTFGEALRVLVSGLIFTGAVMLIFYFVIIIVSLL